MKNYYFQGDVTEKIDIDAITSENSTETPVYMQYREVWCVENNDRLVKDAQ